jgi:hypothetical protein
VQPQDVVLGRVEQPIFVQIAVVPAQQRVREQQAAFRRNTQP